MKKILLYFFTLAPAFAQQPLTLRDCFDLALKQSERVQIQEENIRLAEKKFAQATSALLPKISFKGSEFLQDTSGQSDSGSLTNTLTRFSRPELRFNAKQPVFAGLREFFAMKAQGTQKRIDQAEWENAKRGLFLDVAKAFYTVIQFQKELELLKETEATLKNRLKELERRTKLGKSRESEKISTETELAIHQANLSEMEGALISAKEILSFFTGSSIDFLVDNFNLPDTLPDEKTFTTLVEKRPDVQSAIESQKKARSLLAVEKGGHFPTINAEANYYVHRVGFQENIDWDTLFSLDFPLFHGGETRARVQQAKIQLRQSELASSEKKRLAESEIKRAYQEFVASQRQVAALQLAKEKSEKNFRMVEEDYRLGLVDNLDVLTTLKNLQEIRRNYHRLSARAKINYFTLRAASGGPLP